MEPSRNKDNSILKGWFRNWFRPQPKPITKKSCDRSSNKPPPDLPKDVVWPLNQDLPEPEPAVQKRPSVVPRVKNDMDRYPPCRRSSSYDHIRDCIGVPETKIRPKSAACNKVEQPRPSVGKTVKRSYLVDHSLAQQLTRTSTKSELESSKKGVQISSNISKLNLSPIKESYPSIKPRGTTSTTTTTKLPEYPFAVHPYHDGPKTISVAPSNVPNAKEAYKMLKKMREENSILGDDEMSFVTTYSKLAEKSRGGKMMTSSTRDATKINSDALREKLRLIENQQLGLAASNRNQMRKPTKQNPPRITNPTRQLPATKKVTILTPTSLKNNNRPALVSVQNQNRNSIHDRNNQPIINKHQENRNTLPKYTAKTIQPAVEEKKEFNDPDVRRGVMVAIPNVKEDEKTNPETSSKVDTGKKDEKLRYGIGYAENQKPILWYDAEDLDSSLVVDVVNCEHRINLGKLVERSVKLNLERILSKNGLPWHGSPPSKTSKLPAEAQTRVIKKDIAESVALFTQNVPVDLAIYQNVSDIRAYSRCSQNENAQDTATLARRGGWNRKTHRRTSSLPCLSDFVRTLLDPTRTGLISQATSTSHRNEPCQDGTATFDIKANASKSETLTYLQDTLPIGLLSATDLSQTLIASNYNSTNKDRVVSKMNISTSSRSPIKRIICKPKGKEVVLGKSKIKISINMIQHSKLVVNVIRGVHLLPSNSLLSNAYVKVSLAPDKSQLLNWRSKITKSTNNPFFGFEITIPISAEMLKMRLVISVWNRESNKKRSEFLGCATFRMENFLRKGFAIRGWYRILSFAPMTPNKVSSSISGAKGSTVTASAPTQDAGQTKIAVKREPVTSHDEGTGEPIISDSWLI